MQRFIFSRRSLGSFIAVACMLVAILGVSLFANQAFAVANTAYVALNGSFESVPAEAHLNSTYASTDQLTITLVLEPRNVTGMNNLLTELYDPGNHLFHHWLTQGEFNQLFAPTASQIKQVSSFLKKAGLTLAASPSPFLLRAAGSAAQIEAAFHTRINNYTAVSGQLFFQNASAIQVPASLSSLVVGVSGLASTVRLHPHYILPRQAGQAVPSYGGGPGGSGLTPSQVSSIYDADTIHQLGASGQGKGATLAVFELSGYTQSDISVYEHQFFGASENVPLKNINVDGGPVHPVCPKGDTCGETPGCNKCADFSGDIEVDADIETQIAIAPKIDRILVYNAPNDELGITPTDEYFKIASDDLADSISTSWGDCEQDVQLAGAEAESIAFTQMATQGQSIFDASGDTGAFDCLEGSGFTGRAVEDPSTQTFVTSVGGTSLSSADPGSNKHPGYPSGFESVWNVLNKCNATPAGEAFCLSNDGGASGGGVSTFWPEPSYQSGPGVTTSLSKKAPFCSQAALGQFCREVPDVSANADQFSPYAEYCTGNPKTDSSCSDTTGENPIGWFGIGGTSLSSPLWSGIIALWDGFHGGRFGSANFGLYQLLRSNNVYSKFFHDITGVGQADNFNGFYPATQNYDMATGIGSPRITGIVEHNF